MSDLCERYGSGALNFAQPGDEQQHQTWILRFSDPDCREQVFIGEDAEQRAWAAWNQFAPSYNCYLFQTAPINEAAHTARLTSALEPFARIGGDILPQTPDDRHIYMAGIRQDRTATAGEYREARATLEALRPPTEGDKRVYAMTSLNPEALRGNAPPVEEAIPPREAAAGREIVEAAVRAALEILDEFPGTPHGEIVNAIGDELEFGLDPTDDYDAFIAEVFNRIRED